MPSTKVSPYNLLIAASITLLAACAEPVSDISQANLQQRHKAIIKHDGLLFKDLNSNGMVDPYEDWRLPAPDRAEDLVTRMTLEEKVGSMMHSTLPVIDGVLGVSDNGYDLDALKQGDLSKHITYYLTRLNGEPNALAAQNNAIQAEAEKTRLGIPLSISTDPRHHFQDIVGSSSSAYGLSKWPETIGLAALRDPATSEYFAATVAKDYRKLGIHIALGPQADLASEPRWSRQAGAFSSDVALTQQQVAAVVRGLQGSSEGLTSDGVLSVVKHWVGYGAADRGFDGHNSYGRYVKVDAASIDTHIAAFQGAFEQQVGAVMPTYAVLNQISVDGKPIDVGAGFSQYLLQDLLRKQQGFDGLIISDWYITLDCSKQCREPTQKQTEQDVSMAWGVEDIPRIERFIRGVNAGIDQFGGENDTQPLIDAVLGGAIDESRIDASVKRALLSKFQQGLFENPYVAEQVAVDQDAIDTAYRTQARSQVLLQGAQSLPLETGKTVFSEGMDHSVLTAAGFNVVEDIDSAEVVIIRTSTPFERLHPYQFFSELQKEGRLNFQAGDEAYDILQRAPKESTVVFSVFMDRPPILSEILEDADIVIGNFGVSDEAFVESLIGTLPIEGRLPFELPSSMTAVEAQHSAIPDDSDKPLFPFGFGQETPPK